MADYSGSNSMASLNGLFKERYADNMKRLIPEGFKAVNMIPFLPKDRQPGNLYHQPVVLGMEHGVTFADDTEGAFALNPPVAGQIKDAALRGYQLLLRSVMSYSAASRALGPGERAFEDATKFLVGNMIVSLTKKLEIEIMYGQMGYSVVDAPVVTTGTNDPIILTAAEFASGIWSGAEGMPIELVRAGVVVAGLNNLTVASVNLETRTILVNGATVNIVAGDLVYHKGAFGKEFAGVHKILTNTGTLFGIDATQYTLWKGSEFDVSGGVPANAEVLSFAILQQAIARGVAKGLDTDVTVMVNPSHWDDLLTEQAALRMYDSSFTTAVAENGSKTIKFHSQNGMVEIVPSIYIKEGYSYVICKEDWVRVGSTDITFKRPGQEGNFFRELEDHAGYELRSYTDQALFCARPGRSVLIKGLKISE